MKYALAIALASLVLGGFAHAEDAMVVKVRDLNLHTQAGAAVAIQRMHDAAAVFCTTSARRGLRELDVTTLKCRRDLVDRAVTELGSPQVRYLRSQEGPARMFAEQDAGAMGGTLAR